ncbi:hypothetical protein GE061_003297 [Apolygus lucorum]|uniref:Protein takeout-like n=1 Tax=Apolygus lucorum TaxID=248454 RepID=A0A8S9X136_APOLU|nr:hypothetical protein GE061_003297 [Apolygus lucorum]
MAKPNESLNVDKIRPRNIANVRDEQSIYERVEHREEPRPRDLGESLEEEDRSSSEPGKDRRVLPVSREIDSGRAVPVAGGPGRVPCVLPDRVKEPFRETSLTDDSRDMRDSMGRVMQCHSRQTEPIPAQEGTDEAASVVPMDGIVEDSASIGEDAPETRAANREDWRSSRSRIAMASPQQVGNTIGVATSAEEQRGRTLETIAIIGGTADLFEEMPEQLAIITGCMAQLAEGLRTNISRMDQINRALTRDVATLRYQTRAQQDHSETDSDHGDPCEPDTSRQSDMQERPVTTTPEPPESAHRIGDEPVDQEERYPERAVPPYPPLSPAPPPTLRESVPELKLLLVALVGLTTAAKLPKTWKTCKTDDGMNTCLETAIAEAITSMKNGMPSVGVTPLDPLHVDRLMVDQSTGPVAVKLEFKNMDIKGLTGIDVKNVSSDLMHGHIKFQHYAKKPVIIDADYTIKGSVLILPIQGNGKAKLVFEDSHMDVELKGKVIEKKNEKYFQVENLTTNVVPTHMKINFSNLFNGQKELGDNMNKFLNENWEEIMKELGPSISKGLSAGFKEISNRVFTRVPLSQIVKN